MYAFLVGIGAIIRSVITSLVWVAIFICLMIWHTLRAVALPFILIQNLGLKSQGKIKEVWNFKPEDDMMYTFVGFLWIIGIVTSGVWFATGLFTN